MPRCALAEWSPVGVMHYGVDAPALLDDRVLSRIAALHDVVRRTGHAFYVTYQSVIDGRPGRTAIWLHPAVHLRIVYDSDPDPIGDEELSELASFGIGLGDVNV